MGMFQKGVKVSNSHAPERVFGADFWVDTGALDSFVPEDRLKAIGVEPSARRDLILADGRKVTRDLGFCDFEIEGLQEKFPCPVVFAPKDLLLLPGATALENFGVDADPFRRDSNPSPRSSAASSARILPRKIGRIHFSRRENPSDLDAVRVGEYDHAVE